MDELKRMNWHDWLERNELPKCPGAVSFSLLYLKPSPHNSLVHILSTSSSKSVPRCPQFFAISMWNQAPATVSCTYCRPHRPKGLWDRQFLAVFCDQLLDDECETSLKFSKWKQSIHSMTFFHDTKFSRTFIQSIHSTTFLHDSHSSTTFIQSIHCTTFFHGIHSSTTFIRSIHWTTFFHSTTFIFQRHSVKAFIQPHSFTTFTIQRRSFKAFIQRRSFRKITIRRRSFKSFFRSCHSTAF